MNLKTLIIVFLLTIPTYAFSQSAEEINKTDQQGRKQGHWIKKYPNGKILYDGFFKDDHPAGELKRFYEDQKLKSLLTYSDDGKEAVATTYHANGNIASKGKYINQLKEGKWQFFSVSESGYMFSEEHFSRNIRNGASVKYYPDSTVAERVTYLNDIRQGEWIQYYPNDTICLRSNYLNGKINGQFKVWFENGKIEYSGQYKNDLRDGSWVIFNSDGTIRYKLEYVDGVTGENQMDIDVSDYLDTLERNKGKIADPEKTGAAW
jgi:antitoxin component YwqK of YwqJK toxin-antitoxin module